MGVRAIFQLATPWSEDDIFDVGYEQAADVMVGTHLAYPVQRLVRYDHNRWTLADARFLTDALAPTTFSAVATPANMGTGYVATAYEYLATTLDLATGQESLPTPVAACSNDLTLKGNFNTLSWTIATGAERTNLYRKGGGAFGYIGTTDSNTFVDDNIAPDYSLSFPLQRNPLSGDNNNPAVVAFWQQRAFFGRTLNKPNGIFSSQSGNLFNMNVSRPLTPIDAATFALTGRQVNAIMHLVPLKVLIALTTDAVFSIKGSNGGFTPDGIDTAPEGYRGASRVRPVVIDDIGMFNAAKGGAIRTLGYQFEADGYRGNDLTVFAPHLFRDITIKDMSWSEFPLSTMYAVADDGQVRNLTWQQEQDVWGWGLMSTAGRVESVCNVSEGGEDVAYFVVQREVGGVMKRFIEYNASIRWTDVADCNYLDSSRSYDGEPVTNITGMGHLEGETVTILADGAVYMDHTTILNGALAEPLPAAASKITIGLSYESWIRTLPVDIDLRGSGNTKGEPKTVGGVTVALVKSRGVEIARGKDLPPGQFMPASSDDEIAGPVDEIETRDLEALGEPTRLFSGNYTMDLDPGDWQGASVVLRQRYPLPMHVTGLVPDYVTGD